MNNNAHLGLLYLTHLLIGVDGEVSVEEQALMYDLLESLNIPVETMEGFRSKVKFVNDRDLFEMGMYYVKDCTVDEKIKIFSALYKLAEIDGRVHHKELKMFLCALESSGIELSTIVQATQKKAESI